MFHLHVFSRQGKSIPDESSEVLKNDLVDKVKLIVDYTLTEGKDSTKICNENSLLWIYGILCPMTLFIYFLFLFRCYTKNITEVHFLK